MICFNSLILKRPSALFLKIEVILLKCVGSTMQIGADDCPAPWEWLRLLGQTPEHHPLWFQNSESWETVATKTSQPQPGRLPLGQLFINYGIQGNTTTPTHRWDPGMCNMSPTFDGVDGIHKTHLCCAGTSTSTLRETTDDVWMW